jgi:hypothetical protein
MARMAAHDQEWWYHLFSAQAYDVLRHALEKAPGERPPARIVVKVENKSMTLEIIAHPPGTAPAEQPANRSLFLFNDTERQIVAALEQGPLTALDIAQLLDQLDQGQPSAWVQCTLRGLAGRHVIQGNKKYQLTPGGRSLAGAPVRATDDRSNDRNTAEHR